MKGAFVAAAAAAWLVLAVPAGVEAAAEVTFDVKVAVPPDDDGRHLALSVQRKVPKDSWLAQTSLLVLRRAAPAGAVNGTRVSVSDGGATLRADFVGGTAFDAAKDPVAVGTAIGPWSTVAVAEDDVSKPWTAEDQVPADTAVQYALVPVQLHEGKIVGFPGEAVLIGPVRPEAAWFNRSRLAYLALILLTAGALLIYMRVARTRAKDMFIRRIPGVDAIEDAVGRSTEMGRPVLYVTGIEEITDIQTIASLLILGRVAELTAEYDTEIKVANTYPMTMVVAEEIVRNSYANVGRLDAHRPENIMFVTTEQFAFAAAVNGMILRDRPATNIYLGRFFAESLMLAETGYLTGAVQIAGTAEFTQLPFFIAACDYTLIGEELYATSAYLSRDAEQVAQLKAADAVKFVCGVLIIVGVIAMTAYDTNILAELFP